ncbi:MAG TPA: hypothetical protein VL197_11935 [Nitrospirota bacterium]|nr:hypothetical protein [Nitrospirota bacterium]
MIKTFFTHSYAKIREINQKYEKPRIEMSRWVRASLILLRVYLFSLIGLSVYKFITLLK